MIRRTKEYILENKMIKNHSTVLVALSGGADSVCLLLLLNEIKRPVSYTHLDVYKRQILDRLYEQVLDDPSLNEAQKLKELANKIITSLI